MAVKKTAKKSNKVEEPKDAVEAKPEKYFCAVGRRKSSVAQVRLFPEEKAGENDNIVNNKKAKDYFPGSTLQNSLLAPLRAVGVAGKFKFTILAKGGGFKGQVEASRLGISRALVKYNEEFRKTLKDLGFLTRDSRIVERKKPGLKKARKSPQWAKR